MGREPHSQGSDGGRSAQAAANKYDDPPNSRLFIVCGKSITEDEFKEAFEVFGEIEEIWVLKDKVTNEPKGVTYIKFSKTSEAALAMEEMNGKCIGSHPRPLKVLIAHSRDQGSRREMNEDERLVRLFVVVPKTLSEAELRDHFNQFGDVDYVSIVRDRNTKESKGFAYIKYHRMSHAAKAYEDCDRSFKPVFADPKPQKSNYHESSNGGEHRMNGPGSTTSASTTASVSAGYDMLSYMDTSHTNPEANCRLSVVASSGINQDQLWRLFDLVPGLDYCELKRQDMRNGGAGGRERQNNKAWGVVVFNNPQSATYAKEKLHGFEYPPGHRLIVKFEEMNMSPGYNLAPPSHYNMGHHHHRPPQHGYPQPPPAPSHHHHNGYPPHHHNGPRMPPQNHHHHQQPPRPQPAITNQQQQQQQQPSPAIPTDLQSLADTIAQATSLIQAAGFAPPATPAGGAPAGAAVQQSPGETYDPSYCSVKLPGPQPLAPIDSVVAERLFIVCTPSPPPLYALKDVFGRFGGLIDIYLLNGKTCGYAKYAGKESAERAVTSLHGQEVCGSRLKVMPADPQEKDSTRKRPKMMEQD